MGKHLSPEYQAYMASDEWRRSKLRWRRGRRPKRCWVCRSTVVDAHHSSYRRFMRRGEYHDLRALCRRHHDALDRFKRKYGMRVETATRWFLAAAVARRVLTVVAVPVVSYFAVLGALGAMR